jgi:hypothetical protein
VSRVWLEGKVGSARPRSVVKNYRSASVVGRPLLHLRVCHHLTPPPRTKTGADKSNDQPVDSPIHVTLLGDRERKVAAIRRLRQGSAELVF